MFRNMQADFAAVSLIFWPHRLTVRTPGFHPGNRGSIPREVTKKSAPVYWGVFLGGFPWGNESNPGSKLVTIYRFDKV